MLAAMLRSLRINLAVYSVGLSLAVLILLISVSFFSLGDFLEDSNVETTHHNLQITMDIIDREISALKQLMSWFATSSEMMNLVSSAVEGEAAERTKIMTAYNVLKNSLYGNTLYGYMTKLVIVDRYGRSIQLGSVQGHWSDGDLARRQAQSSDQAIIKDPYHYGTGSTVIALGKAIFQEYTGNEVAWIQVCLNTELLTKYLSEYTFEQNSRILFIMDQTALTLDAQRRFLPSAVDPGPFRQALAATEAAGNQKSLYGNRSRVRLKVDGQNQLYVVYRAKGTGWLLAQSVPTMQLDQRNSVFLVLLGLVVLALTLLVFLLLMMVNRIINRPIGQIQRRLSAIARGDFSHDRSIEYSNELGDIGRGINTMSHNIEELIQRRVADERTKKNLEFKMLQSQINPHFLFNTLNSIKWMAEIQQSSGIAEMVGSLAVLLQHVAKGTDELIPLSQELELVREYCTIQDFRTGGLATLKIMVDEAELSACPVIKFTLQPLVENALQHGIEPAKRPGTILIHCHRKEDRLFIDVTDDGVGIPAGRIEGILAKDRGHGDKSFNHIGLKNVDERIKLHFGPEYGLAINSQEGSFTTVSVIMPLASHGILSTENIDVQRSDS